MIVRSFLHLMGFLYVADEQLKHILIEMANFDTLGWTFAEVRCIKVKVVPCQRSGFRVILLELKCFIFICSSVSRSKSAWSWKDSIQAAVFSGWNLFNSWKRFRVKGGILHFLRNVHTFCHLICYSPNKNCKPEVTQCFLVYRRSNRRKGLLLSSSFLRAVEVRRKVRMKPGGKQK